MCHCFHPLNGDGLRYHSGEILQDDPSRTVRKSALKCETLMTNAASDIDENWPIRSRISGDLRLERKNIQEILLTLTAGSDPESKVVAIGWFILYPQERCKICFVGLLESALATISRVLVFSLRKEGCQCLHTRHNEIVAGARLHKHHDPGWDKGGSLVYDSSFQSRHTESICDVVRGPYIFRCLSDHPITCQEA